MNYDLFMKLSLFVVFSFVGFYVAALTLNFSDPVGTAIERTWFGLMSVCTYLWAFKGFK